MAEDRTIRSRKRLAKQVACLMAGEAAPGQNLLIDLSDIEESHF
jgi:hypothetical protein